MTAVADSQGIKDNEISKVRSIKNIATLAIAATVIISAILNNKDQG